MPNPGCDTLRSTLRDRDIRFRTSVIEGVEIKRCKGSLYDYKKHVHNELSLGYILSGSTELTLSGRTLHYEAGDGVIIPPLMPHRCAPNDIHDWEYIMLFIDPGYYENAVHFTQAKQLTGPEVGKLVRFLGQLIEERDPDALETVLLELLLEFGDGAAPDEEIPDGVRLVHDYITGHLREPVTLDRLQELSGLNKFTLIRHFKRIYVTTPAAFHLQCRIALAKEMLNRNTDSLTICSELNFYDQAHFIREFRKMYEVTPAAYTAQLKP